MISAFKLSSKTQCKYYSYITYVADKNYECVNFMKMNILNALV